MGNIVIVGANQGIGYYMVERLLESGNSVTVLDADCVKTQRRKQHHDGQIVQEK